EREREEKEANDRRARRGLRPPFGRDALEQHGHAERAEVRDEEARPEERQPHGVEPAHEERVERREDGARRARLEARRITVLRDRAIPAGVEARERRRLELGGGVPAERQRRAQPSAPRPRDRIDARQEDERAEESARLSR